MAAQGARRGDGGAARGLAPRLQVVRREGSCSGIQGWGSGALVPIYREEKRERSITPIQPHKADSGAAGPGARYSGDIRSSKVY